MSDFQSDFDAYMARQNQIASAQHKINNSVFAATPDDPEEDEARLAEMAIKLHNELAESAHQLQESYDSLAHSVVAIRDDAKKGLITKAEAVKRLKEARDKYAALSETRVALSTQIESNKKAIEDPAAERERLFSKYKFGAM